MPPAHKLKRLLAVALGLAVVTTACSEDDDDSDAGADRPEGGFDPATVIDADLEVGAANPGCQGTTDGVLNIGSLLPATGDLAILGPPMFAGVELAVADINAAGGVNGQPIAYQRGDEGTNPDATVEGYLQSGVDVVVGAASTSTSEQQLDRIVEACRIMFSPANTSVGFTVAADDDLYFRTAPPDVIQGRVLSQLALEDGVATAAVLARGGTYGESLAHFTTEPLVSNGVEVTVEEFYSTPSSGLGSDTLPRDLRSAIDAVVDANPDALFLIGYSETADIMRELRARGFTPDLKRIYFADGNTSNTVGSAMAAEPGALAGVRGTYPSAPSAADFTARLTLQDPTLADTVYGPESYDAVVITALAAVAAQSDQPDAVARQINGVTRDGEVCTSFVQCRDLLQAGIDINYDGPSGPQDFARPGEPATATIAVHRFGPDNLIDTTATEWRTASVT